MFEKDYIMRLIREMVRMLLKMLFNLDTETPTSDLLESENEKHVLDGLLNLVDAGDIDQAENRLYELLSDGGMDRLEMALLFYSYLNDKDEVFLKEHGFSREEIRQGLSDVISEYGLEGIADVFMSDSQ